MDRERQAELLTGADDADEAEVPLKVNLVPDHFVTRPSGRRGVAADGTRRSARPGGRCVAASPSRPWPTTWPVASCTSARPATTRWSTPLSATTSSPSGTASPRSRSSATDRPARSTASTPAFSTCAAHGQLAPHTVTIPGDDSPHYGLSEGDLVTWRQIQKVPGDARIENGTRGLITRADPQRDEVPVALVGSDRHVDVTGPNQLAGLRLGYAQHVVRQQGATVERAVAVTGGWQTSRETAYVQASRARHGIDWYIARDQLGEEGTDVERLHKLAQRMAASRTKTPSIAHEEAGPGYDLAAGYNLSTDLDGPTIPRPAPDFRIDDGIDR